MVRISGTHTADFSSTVAGSNTDAGPAKPSSEVTVTAGSLSQKLDAKLSPEAKAVVGAAQTAGGWDIHPSELRNAEVFRGASIASASRSVEDPGMIDAQIEAAVLPLIKPAIMQAVGQMLDITHAQESASEGGDQANFRNTFEQAIEHALNAHVSDADRRAALKEGILDAVSRAADIADDSVTDDLAVSRSHDDPAAVDRALDKYRQAFNQNLALYFDRDPIAELTLIRRSFDIEMEGYSFIESEAVSANSDDESEASSASDLDSVSEADSDEIRFSTSKKEQTSGGRRAFQLPIHLSPDRWGDADA